MPQAHQELELLYLALRSDCGIVVSTSHARAAQQRLYQARARACDPELDCLEFRTSPIDPQGEVWIKKAKAQLKELAK